MEKEMEVKMDSNGLFINKSEENGEMVVIKHFTYRNS